VTAVAVAVAAALAAKAVRIRIVDASKGDERENANATADASRTTTMMKTRDKAIIVVVAAVTSTKSARAKSRGPIQHPPPRHENPLLRQRTMRDQKRDMYSKWAIEALATTKILARRYLPRPPFLSVERHQSSRSQRHWGSFKATFSH
jgi:hypothetical protein